MIWITVTGHINRDLTWMSKGNHTTLNWLWTSVNSVLVTHHSGVQIAFQAAVSCLLFFKQRPRLKRKLTFRGELTPCSRLCGKLLSTSLCPLKIPGVPHWPGRDSLERACTGFTYPELLEFLRSQVLHV